MNKKRPAILIAASLLVASLGTWWFIQEKQEPQTVTSHAVATTPSAAQAQDVEILDYNAERDKEAIKQLFKDNWYWLIAGDEYDIDYFLDTKSPSKYQPEYHGKMQIKVMRTKDGRFVGFVSYFKKNFFKGDLRFVAVKKDFRGHGYGKQLTKYATDALFDMGVARVKLVTRTTNFAAQKVYKSLGFTETFREGGYVYFEKRAPKR